MGYWEELQRLRGGVDKIQRSNFRNSRMKGQKTSKSGNPQINNGSISTNNQLKLLTWFSNTESWTPQRNGMGAIRLSFIFNGRIGMKMCCQTIGYKNEFAAWMQDEITSKFFDVKMILLSFKIAAKISIINFGSTKLKYKFKLCWNWTEDYDEYWRLREVRDVGDSFLTFSGILGSVGGLLKTKVLAPLLYNNSRASFCSGTFLL